MAAVSPQTNQCRIKGFTPRSFKEWISSMIEPIADITMEKLLCLQTSKIKTM